MPFNFQLVTLPWNAHTVRGAVRHYEASLPSYGWPNWVLGNHDNPRIASRVGPEQARVGAMLLLTLRGTPTMYYGDEIGMCDVPIPRERVQDPFEKNVPGMGLGRDPERTPMQWDAGANAGFSAAEPWLPLAEDFRTKNVAAQRDDPRSMLGLYRRLIDLRRGEPALTVGSYAPVEVSEESDVVAFVRRHGGSRLLVALNLGARPQRLQPAEMDAGGTIVLSTHLDREGERLADVSLRPNEGLVIRLPASDA
jgi:alpha-glucosidase